MRQTFRLEQYNNKNRKIKVILSCKEEALHILKKLNSLIAKGETNKTINSTPTIVDSKQKKNPKS